MDVQISELCPLHLLRSHDPYLAYDWTTIPHRCYRYYLHSYRILTVWKSLCLGKEMYSDELHSPQGTSHILHFLYPRHISNNSLYPQSHFPQFPVPLDTFPTIPCTSRHISHNNPNGRGLTLTCLLPYCFPPSCITVRDCISHKTLQI